MNFTHVEILIRRSFIFHPIPMTFWLKTPNNIYKNWLNSHFDRIMFTVSKLEIKKVKIVLEHPVYKKEIFFDKKVLFIKNSAEGFENKSIMLKIDIFTNSGKIFMHEMQPVLFYKQIIHVGRDY